MPATRTKSLQLLPDLALFVAVAREKSFSAAARALAIPVSTISRRLADLEARLGVPLLVRTTRRVELTAIGEKYLARALAIVEEAEATHAELVSEAQAPRGVVRVSTTQDFAVTYLAPLIVDLLARYPEIAIELDTSARAVDLIGERFDIAVRLGELTDSQLTTRKLGETAQSLYGAPALVARARLDGPRSLERHPCLRIQGGVAERSAWRLVSGEATETVRVSGPIVAGSMRMMLELAIAGAGFAVLDDSIARPAVAGGTIVRVLHAWRPPPVAVHALTPSRLVPARTRVFLDCLTDHLVLEGTRSDAPPRRGR